jgi:hypothetical protein
MSAIAVFDSKIKGTVLFTEHESGGVMIDVNISGLKKKS